MILSYVPQDTSMLNGSLSEFAEANRVDESLFKAILRKMDLAGKKLPVSCVEEQENLLSHMSVL